jgi:2-polyprenyl-3-methyl-5-hydroxy-6-metoxy-1,4-benzoquinol methylase
MKTNWRFWNNEYNDKHSDLNKRLDVIKNNILTCFKELDNPNILSICSGQGRDILETILDNNIKYNNILLIDIDQDSINVAQEYISNNNMSRIITKTLDAGFIKNYNNFRADLLLAVGFFGHLSFSDIENTIIKIKQLINNNSYIVWSANERTFNFVKTCFENSEYEHIHIIENISEKNYFVGLTRFTGIATEYSAEDYIFTYDYKLGVK